MQDAMIHYMRVPFSRTQLSGKAPLRGGSGRSQPGGLVPSALYPCKPGGPNDYVYVFCSRGNADHWQRLLKVIGREDLIGDERYDTGPARSQRAAEVDEIIAAWTREHTKEEAMRIIGEAGVPAGAVFDTVELMNDPSLAERGIMQTIEHPTTGKFKMPAWPVRFDGAPAKVKPSPLLGQHNAEVLGQLARHERRRDRRLKGRGHPLTKPEFGRTDPMHPAKETAMKLYYAPGVCSIGIHVLLEEIGKPYELKRSICAKARNTSRRSPGEREIEGAGPATRRRLDPDRVPGDRHLSRADEPAGQADPAGPGDRDPRDGGDGIRRRHDARQGFARIFRPGNLPRRRGPEKVKARGREMVEKGFAVLDKALAGKNYLGGNELSAADAAVFYVEFWGAGRLGMKLPANVAAHYERMKARPAVQRALQAEGLN